jgi:peptidoglycan/xylan/chitin deacetylase (PgdA/CDA1 family)
VRSRGELAAAALDRTGVGALLRRRRPWRGVLVVNYHRIAPVEHPPINKDLWSATPAGFDAQVRFLSRHCDVIGPEELGPRLGARRPSVLITFDDGYRDGAEHALPILRAHGASATFFLTTGFLDRRATAWWDEIAWMVAHSPQRGLPADRWLGDALVLDGDRDRPTSRLVARYKALPWEMRERFLEHLAVVTGSGRRPLADQDGDWLSWEDVRALASAGMAIGAHTVTHPILASLPARLQHDEVGSCLDRLEHELGRRPSLFSYPVGMRDSFDAASRAAVRDHGVRLAFSNYGGMARPSRWDPLDVPRTNVWRGMSSHWFRALTAAPPLFARW